MTTWQRSSALDLALWLATVTMVTALCLATTAARACPDPCQCTQTYYVYCQRLGLTSDRVLELVTSVPREALLLDLSSNALDRLGSGLLDSLPNLEYLYVDDNLLSSLGAGLFRYQRSLRELSLTGNRLRGVRGDVFANVTSLRKLRLDGNAIEKIDARAFSSLTQLRELHVPRNNLTRLALSQLSGLAGLRVLDLSDNWINTVEVGAFRDLAGLQSLRLSRNRLSSLAEDAFRGLSSLRELHLDGNLLPSLDCFHVPHLAHSLHTLVLSGNALVSVPHDVFPKLAGLKVLALDRNLVSSVGPMAFRDLQLDSLSLAHNLLEGVDRQMLEGCRRVSRLDLSHNRIRTVRTGAFDSVRESVYVLNLAGNGLSSLDHGTLRGMRHLLALNLSSNGLTSILRGSFAELVQLTSLDLDRNSLQRLSAEQLQGPRLERLSVLHNPLKEMTGFTFEDEDLVGEEGEEEEQQPKRSVEVWVNLTQEAATARSVTVTWPFREGGQLYWTLRVWCDRSSSSTSLTDLTCSSSSSSSSSGSSGSSVGSQPLLQWSVSPNKVRQTVEGLRPGQRYVVCVDPVFLSPRVRVSQCGAVTTTDPMTLTTLNPQDHHHGHRPASSGQGPSLLLPRRGADGGGTVGVCVLMMTLLVVWWTSALRTEAWAVFFYCFFFVFSPFFRTVITCRWTRFWFKSRLGVAAAAPPPPTLSVRPSRVTVR